MVSWLRLQPHSHAPTSLFLWAWKRTGVKPDSTASSSTPRPPTTTQGAQEGRGSSHTHTPARCPQGNQYLLQHPQHLLPSDPGTCRAVSVGFLHHIWAHCPCKAPPMLLTDPQCPEVSCSLPIMWAKDRFWEATNEARASPLKESLKLKEKHWYMSSWNLLQPPLFSAKVGLHTHRYTHIGLQQSPPECLWSQHWKKSSRR